MKVSPNAKRIILALIGCLVAFCIWRSGQSAFRTGRGGWTGEGPPPERTLRFSKEYSIGRLSTRDWKSTSPAEWKHVGDALGDVHVPAGKAVMLSVYYRYVGPSWSRFLLQKIGLSRKPPKMDLSPLKNLHAYDLHSIHLGDAKIVDGDLKYVGKLTGLQAVHFPQMLPRRRPPMPNYTDEGIQHLAGLTNLRKIWFDAFITDKSLSYFTNFKLMEELDLSSCEVKGPGLIHLTEMSALKKLSLPQRLEGKAFKPMLQMRGLEELAIGGSGKYDVARIDDEGLAYLRNLDTLQRLVIGSNNVTDEGLAHLRHFKSLRSLQIYSESIKGPGLKYVGEMTSLEELKFRLKGMSGAGHVAPLSNLKNLRRLSIYNHMPNELDAVYREVVEKMRQAIPNCEISWDICI